MAIFFAILLLIAGMAIGAFVEGILLTATMPPCDCTAAKFLSYQEGFDEGADLCLNISRLTSSFVNDPIIRNYTWETPVNTSYWNNISVSSWWNVT